MAATIMDVRRRPLNDLTQPYLFSDEDIQQALDEAKELLTLKGVNVDTVLGAKAQRLMVGRDIITDFLNRIQSRAVTSISGGSDSVSLVDLTATKTEIERDLNTLLEQLGGNPAEVA
jgi:hypothetical protein